jgi:hypothetical protein
MPLTMCFIQAPNPSLPIEMADGKWQETIRTFDRASMVPDEHLEAMDHLLLVT